MTETARNPVEPAQTGTAETSKQGSKSHKKIDVKQLNVKEVNEATNDDFDSSTTLSDSPKHSA